MTHSPVDPTDTFFLLTPDRILESVEAIGIRCTGRCLPLNSLENRVYEVEIEINDDLVERPSDRFRVIKFYRPGRWSQAQILDEHSFILELAEQELPVIAPLPNAAGETVIEVEDLGLYAAVFPKKSGRLEPELSDERLLQLGRLLARVHARGAGHPASHRMKLTPSTYGRENLRYLIANDLLPKEIQSRYGDLVAQLCDLLEPKFAGVPLQRIHGDCHSGNILWAGDEVLLLDFDDMVMGPVVQDLWLVLPGRDKEAMRQREVLLEGYEQFRSFDRTTWELVEGLRALRFIHFATWIGKRWNDPSFKLAFPHYGSFGYWREQLGDLQEQVQLLSGYGGSREYDDEESYQL